MGRYSAKDRKGEAGTTIDQLSFMAWDFDNGAYFRTTNVDSDLSHLEHINISWRGILCALQ